MLSGSFLALSMVMLLTTLVSQSSASHFGSQENTYKSRFPPMGSTYAVDIDGSAKISGKPTVKPASIDLKFKVVSLKTTGIPQIHFQLTEGQLTLGDDVYELTKGTAVIQVNKINMRVTNGEGTVILLLYGTIDGPFPIKTTEDPAKIVPGQDRKSASIQIMTDKWILGFNGSIDRIA